MAPGATVISGLSAAVIACGALVVVLVENNRNRNRNSNSWSTARGRGGGAKEVGQPALCYLEAVLPASCDTHVMRAARHD